MSTVTASSLPTTSLLNRYERPSWEGPIEPYTDSFAAQIAGEVDITQFVTAFYTTRLFRLERLVLKFLAGKPSTDRQAERMAAGEIEVFAAWNVEARTDNQLLMCDFRARTRSWFMVEPIGAGLTASERAGTLLRFGSAVVPASNAKTGEEGLGRGFETLLGFHKLYSRWLLGSAVRRLTKRAR